MPRRRSLPLLGAVFAALLLPVMALAALPADASPAVSGVVSHRNSRVCAKPAAGSAGCLAVRRDAFDGKGRVVRVSVPALPSGYGPADIRSAYKLPAPAAGVPTGPLVAIVDAYDDPKAEQDLAVYRSRYGLPACTTANGCFRKVNQTGGTTPPQADGGWAQEISLDLDMVSAACPACRILLVEANNPSFANLGTAVNTAARLGAKAISNSYGGDDTSASSAYNHPGIAVVASTGDSGYGVQSPASFQTVVAVGGTALKRSNTAARGWTETAWSGAGSGCSTINPKPAWQTSATACSRKASADVSAVADPQTGVAVYDSYAYDGVSGWLVFGGTSASAPIVGSIYAQRNTGVDYPASYTWAHASGLFDVTSGSNGSCSTSVWCHAVKGWDGPTGLGTPNGLSAF